MSEPGVHYPHRIRLRGPWDCEPLDPPGPPRRVTMPCRWGEGGLPGFSGRARFARRFGYPGRIDDHERVWLTFAGVEGTADVSLNGKPLGGHDGEGSFEFDVTSLLTRRNELVVAVTAGSDRGGLWGEVALEVRRTAFLRGVGTEALGEGEVSRLLVRGEVVGTAGRPLELYVLLDGATVAYDTVEPAAGGAAFAIVTAAPARPGQVRVELIDGATVWYAVTKEMPV